MQYSVVFVSFHNGVPWPGPKSAEGDGAAHRILRKMSGPLGSGQKRGAKAQTGPRERSVDLRPVSPRGAKDREKARDIEQAGKGGGGLEQTPAEEMREGAGGNTLH